uniref:Uncharacterized protein n=1 Tax=Rousettus aegyptiacus TaxID=9407 RepID=A0A7J8EK91_ROUAE|nr:hypothetical protein HJG63_012453 [Rousettus aegyptiacus]
MGMQAHIYGRQEQKQPRVRRTGSSLRLQPQRWAQPDLKPVTTRPKDETEPHGKGEGRNPAPPSPSPGSLTFKSLPALVIRSSISRAPSVQVASRSLYSFQCAGADRAWEGATRRVLGVGNHAASRRPRMLTSW